ncbi:MAG: class II aldolase/adducin family protein [Anaerolineaceae bacterium]|nr:class II aldolase/adducin family protein [Anaerolineaceae bacterium]
MNSMENEQQLREDICEVCKMMYSRGLIVGPSGNASAKLDDNHILLTPGGLLKFKMDPDQLIIVDMDGNKVGPGTEANQDLKPTSELSMHLEIYRQRPDIKAITHAHPSNVVALSSCGIQLKPTVLTEGMLFLGPIPTAEYATPTTPELADTLSELIVNHDAIVLPYHGAIIGGHDIWNAFAKMEVIEQLAEIQILTRLIGGDKALPRHHVESMLALRIKYNHQLPGDSMLLQDYE